MNANETNSTFYSVQDSGEGLRAMIEVKHSFQTGLMFGVIGGTAVGSLALTILKLSVREAIAVGCVAALIASYQRWFTKRVTLETRKSEFVSRGRIRGEGFKAHRTASYADIRWLEYRNESAGDVAYIPQGLYAVLKTGSVCLLPNLDRERTIQLITRIEAKLPAFSQQWKRGSEFDGHFQTLGLTSR